MYYSFTNTRMRKSGEGLYKHVKSKHSRKTAKRLAAKKTMLAAKKKKRG